MASPVLGLTELASGQAIPETNVNERGRWWEFFATGGGIEDRDLATPPGSPSDGDAYLVAASATGAWAGQDGNIALRINTAWAFVAPAEGMQLYVRDENQRIIYDGSAWVTPASTGGGVSETQPGEQISGFIASPSNKDYRITLNMAHAGTITATTTRSASGTCTATFKVNSTALGGTANSVSSTEQERTHSSSNTFVAGDDIVLTVSSNSACADMSFTIKYTRTLAA